jgi:NAD-dependent dihydropyrimidine dehydrogenase PreA subunit
MDSRNMLTSLFVIGICCMEGNAFIVQSSQSSRILSPSSSSSTKLNADDFDSGSSDANRWQSSDIPPYSEQDDWETAVNARQDGSLWSSFTSDEDDVSSQNNNAEGATVEDVDDGEAWLDAIAKISADEIDFINVEADRADKVRQMQEMEFSAESIAATLGVAVDESKEIDPENALFEQFKEETQKSGFGMYLDDEYDMETVESHVMVEFDEETNEPIRQQMVYVDEHTCIGCTNCAMVSDLSCVLNKVRLIAQQLLH